jgi:hypothetical protein
MLEGKHSNQPWPGADETSNTETQQQPNNDKGMMAWQMEINEKRLTVSDLF